MSTNDLIPAEDFCINYNVRLSFINNLEEFGLIEIRTMNDTPFIPLDQLPALERMLRLHTELNINLEGIHAISQLLDRMDALQSEIKALKNRLRMFDQE